MVSNVFLNRKVIADCVCSAVCHDHSLALAADLIAAVLQKVGHNHFGLLCDGVAVLFVILEQRTGGCTLHQFRVILRYANQLKSLTDGRVVGQHIQNIAFFDSLSHGIYMERRFDWFALRCLSYNCAEGLKSLPLRCCSEREERLVIVSALTDDGVYILIC